MLDYIKIEIKDRELINKVWSHSDLVYNSEHTYLNKSDGNLKAVFRKTYLNLKFTHYENRLEIDGSLHKLFNSGLHNANDFTVSDCILTINKLCLRFGIDPALCHVNNLEFGININTPINVSDFVKWLRFHHRNQFVKFPKLDQCYFAGTDYFGVKAYNKTLQFPEYATPDLFRFEGKTRQSKYLKTKGIRTLNDLIDPGIYRPLSDVLLSEWGNVLIFDKRTKKGVKFCNTDFWLDIIENNHRNTFLKTKKKYFRLLGENGLQNLIYRAIEDKLILLNKCAYSTSLDPQNNFYINAINGQKTIKTSVHIPTIVKVENIQRTEPAISRICLVTGLDISMQKPTSKYLCLGGLKWYWENEPETYRHLADKYLTAEKRGYDLKRQFYYIAHNIRNTKTNPNHNLRNNRRLFEQRNYNKYQLQFNY